MGRIKYSIRRDPHQYLQPGLIEAVLEVWNSYVISALLCVRRYWMLIGGSVTKSTGLGTYLVWNELGELVEIVIKLILEPGDELWIIG